MYMYMKKVVNEAFLCLVSFCLYDCGDKTRNCWKWVHLNVQIPYEYQSAVNNSRVCVCRASINHSYQIHDEYWDNNYGNCLITLNSNEQEVQSLWMTKRDIWYTKMETIWPIDVREPVTFYKWLLTLSKKKKKIQKNSNVQKWYVDET